MTWPTPSAPTGSFNPTVRRLASAGYQIIAGSGAGGRPQAGGGLSESARRHHEADDRKVMELGLIENLQRRI